MKVMTVVGTRPELIRLSRVIHRLDETVDHVLVHTGQNYDYSLNQVFFEDLGLRAPDHYMGVDTSSLGNVLGGILVGTEKEGLTPETLAQSDVRVRIPISGMVNSLNVATSAAIVIYEAVRQRRRGASPH